MLRDRRLHPRYALRLPINLRLERWSPAVLVDLSRGGMWLRTRARSPLGSPVRIEMHRRAGGDCAPAGRVVRALLMPGIGGFAVHFEAGGALDPLFDAAETLPDTHRISFLATELAPRIEISAAAG
jgi:PilZ domain-containing protein